MKHSSLRFFFLLAGMLILGVAACSHMPFNDPAAQLQKRVIAHWQAKQAKQWAKAYTFYCKAYRESTSQKQYEKAANIDIQSFDIETLTLSQDKATAQVMIKYAVMVKGYRFEGIKMTEVWQLEGSTWCLTRSGSPFKNMFMPKKPKSSD